ncbi:hypothetical protein ACOMHN_032535 [Nucella lapillus]
MAVAFERPQSQNIPIMDCGRQRPVSVLARGVQITELCDGSCMNPDPDPIGQQESPTFRDQCLSPTKLQLLTGSDRLEGVSSLELKVDTSRTFLNNFGLLLPNLTVLKLSGSVVPNIRDLGSSLRSVEVLWMRSCGVQELEGVCSMGRLRELYLAYNDVADLSPLSLVDLLTILDLEGLLDLLTILDLEGNNIDDIDQLDCLALCCNLQHLTLEGNPVCVAPHPEAAEENYDYRQAVKQVLTTLCTLDDRPLTGASQGSGSASPQNVFDADWAFLQELQGDALLIESLENESETVSAAGRPATAALLPAADYRPGSALKSASSVRPVTSANQRPASISGGRPSSAWTDSSKPRPASSDGVEGVEAVSDLTCGRVICGNPSKALRARREAADLEEATLTSDSLAGKPPVPKPSGSLGLASVRPMSAAKQMEEEEERRREEGGKEEEGKETGPIEDKDLTSLLLELKSWKKDHEKRLEKIRESKTAQVLKIEDDSEDRDSNLSPVEDPDSPTDFSEEQGHRSPPPHPSSNRNPPPWRSSIFSYDGDEPLPSPTPLSVSHDRAEKLVPRRSSASSVKDKDKFLNEDSGLLKEYSRSAVLEGHPDRPTFQQGSGGDHNHLRELRLPSAGVRPPNRQPVRGPPPSSRRMTLSPGRESSPPKDRPRKVRIGPTGLPGSSSQAKHGQTGDLKPRVGRGGGGGGGGGPMGPMPPSVHRSPLPPTAAGSQHRVRRSLPEVTPLPSRPTTLFRS